MDKRKLALGMVSILATILFWNIGSTLSAEPVKQPGSVVVTTVTHRELIKLSGGSLLETRTVTHSTSTAGK